jgi:hypothetical protein
VVFTGIIWASIIKILQRETVKIESYRRKNPTLISVSEFRENAKNAIKTVRSNTGETHYFNDRKGSKVCIRQYIVRGSSKRPLFEQVQSW